MFEALLQNFTQEQTMLLLFVIAGILILTALGKLGELQKYANALLLIIGVYLLFYIFII